MPKRKPPRPQLPKRRPRLEEHNSPARAEKANVAASTEPALIRCAWVRDDLAWARNDLARRYHDEEWGVPLHDDHRLFEFIVLEGAQAGLSWDTILRKRDSYREAFDNFDPAIVARYDHRRVERLLKNASIVRNRLKIASAIQNARAFLKVRDEFATFDKYIWGFVDGAPKRNAWKAHKEIPAETPEAAAMSKDLRKRGFNFVGPTICYAFMQAVGIVNDHLVDCFRYKQIR